ncbi:MAG: VIT domain-containing protein [Cytophagales bacterium]
MKTAFTLAIAFFSFSSTFAYNNLSVSDPRFNWNTEKGTIKEATISVRPAGNFSEVSLFLTFSAQNTSWASKTDSLEIVLDFDLPQDAQMTDSWLWIGDDIVKALMLDRSQATQIYESIVKRRKDPSIVYKNSSTQYQLRVFPMLGNETRKVKLTFLIPSKMEKDFTYTDIPMNILQASRTLPQNLECIAYESDKYYNPVFVQWPFTAFTRVKNDEFAKGKKAIMPSLSDVSFLSLRFSHTINADKQFSTYTQNGETYFQLVLDHMEAFGLEKPSKKTVFVIDYESPQETIPQIFPFYNQGYYYYYPNDTAYKTKVNDSSFFYKTNLYSFKSMKESIKNILLQKFSGADKFNVAFSKDTFAQKQSENWILTTPDNINTYLDGLDSTFAGKSSLVYSLPEAYKFIKAQGGGSVYIVTNRHQYEDISLANGLKNRLDKINYKVDRIDLFDFSNTAKAFERDNSNVYYNYYGANITTTYNNKLFQLASHTKFFNQILGGCYGYNYKYNRSYNYYYYKCYGNNDISNAASIFDNYFEKLTNFDYTAFINSGYNYNEHLLGLVGSSSANPYGKLSLVGKYKGSLPFTLRLSAKYKGVQKNATLTFTVADTIATSGLLRQFWAGHEINTLESRCSSSNDYYYSNCYPDVDTRLEILKTSLENRVLSKYSAFFAPEIGFQNVEACSTCVDETKENFVGTALASDFGQPSFVNSPQNLITSIGNDSLFKSLEIKIFPNPATEKATIQVKNIENVSIKNIKIELYNLQGTLIFTIEKPVETDNTLEYVWNLNDKNGSRVAKGIYVAALNFQGIKKFIKIVVE